MQSVADAFSVEEVDTARKIASSIQVAWKKDLRPGASRFTIGVSLIAGGDFIPGVDGSAVLWNKYQYQDESSRLIDMAYERGLNLPEGGLTKALADFTLDNTASYYTPGYAGGSSAIFTAVNQPGRPINLAAGFNYNGIDNTVPQFVGLTSRPPLVDTRSRTAQFQAEDFMGYIQNAYVDKTAMFTTDSTDAILQRALQDLGYTTAQYDLDPGINIVNFGLFETGQKWGDYVDQLVKAENGHLYQDESGVIKFDNRQHWSQFPYFNVQRVIATSQVINAVLPNADHIINVVEVKASPRILESSQRIWELSVGGGSVLLPVGDTEVWASYDDPIFSVTTPVPNGTVGQTSYYAANLYAVPLPTGGNRTFGVSIKSITNFAQSSKIVFTNNLTYEVYLTVLDIWGRPARKTGDIYYKEKVDSSITAYGERPLIIENDYIQNSDWAKSLAGIILADFARPENLQELTIRAIPELQLGDLISWQGRYWRVYDIKTQLSADSGFIQELKLLQRTIRTYFRIGVSLIGGPDVIAP